MRTALKLIGIAVLATLLLAVTMAAMLRQELGSAGIALRDGAGHDRDDRPANPDAVARPMPLRDDAMGADRPRLHAASEAGAVGRPGMGGPGIADAAPNGAAAPEAPVAADAATPKLEEERARSASLDRDLAGTRSDLVAARTALAEENRRHAEAEQAAKLADQTGLAAEAARAAGLERELAAVRSALAETQARTDGLLRERDERQRRGDAEAQALQAAEAAQQAAQERAQQDGTRRDREQADAAQRFATLQAQLAAEAQHAARLDQERAAARIDLAGAESRLDDLTHQLAEARSAAEAEQAKTTVPARDGPRGQAAQVSPPTQGASGVSAVLKGAGPRPSPQRDAAAGGPGMASPRAKLGDGQPDAPASSAPSSAGADGAARPLSGPQPNPAGDRQAADASPAADLAPREASGILVVLRYAHRSDKAHAHAMALQALLQGKGVVVADPVGSPKAGAGSRLSFFYDEDKPEADRLATLLAMPRPLQGSLPSDDPLPRPGTIEISVGG